MGADRLRNQQPDEHRDRDEEKGTTAFAPRRGRHREESTQDGARFAPEPDRAGGATIVANLTPAAARRPYPRFRVPTSVPEVVFRDQRLANGLRVIVAEDHLAPVVAINLWYDVGSKHEVPGKTGFAHLFEHVMFQGSRHVGKAEHVAIVQAAGGTMNGSTWLDRTNYFETMPAHQMELGLWLEADRMATLLDALSQENLDNQREVVKNEKRWSYDNRPYGSWQEKLQAHLFPPEHPYHHSTIGSMDDLDAASIGGRQRLLPDLLRPEQRRAVGGRRRRDRRGPCRG